MLEDVSGWISYQGSNTTSLSTRILANVLRALSQQNVLRIVIAVFKLLTLQKLYFSCFSYLTYLSFYYQKEKYLLFISTVVITDKFCLYLKSNNKFNQVHMLIWFLSFLVSFWWEQPLETFMYGLVILKGQKSLRRMADLKTANLWFLLFISHSFF